MKNVQKKGGVLVYPEYIDDVHYTNRAIRINRDSPLYLGTVFGRTICTVLGQLSPSGQLRVLDEICADDCGLAMFAKDLLIPKLEDECRMHAASVYNFCDPAGNLKSCADMKTCVQFLRESVPGDTLIACALGENPAMLRDSVAKRLRGRTQGNPGIIIGPKCKILRAGFQGGYRFCSHDTTIRPERNMFSRAHEALQHLCYGLFKRQQGRI